MALKLELQLVVKERKVAIIMMIPNPDNYEHYVESYRQKHSVCVWAKFIEQELSLSVCLKPVCLQITSV